jgi:hypothetical protein
MRENILKILLDELRTLRLLCQGEKQGAKCGAVFEFHIDRLGDAFRPAEGGPPSFACPFCKTSFHPSSFQQLDPISALVKAINDMRAVRRVNVEFVLPART